ncbi:transmembrane protease serine 9-like [Cimex lectularius]|uniref:Peptidase S1 domain-containing protein n=1 Tax=Cimex lectularius TaxID=79782 RepID=A0A8I6RDK8_CIMLE|nr:transmembrane protease serine 9-like [Cimex lectularius]
MFARSMWLQIISMLKLLDMASGIAGGSIANYTRHNFIVSAQNTTGYHFFAGVIISVYHVLSTCSDLAEVSEAGVMPLENLGNVQLVAGETITNPEQIRYPERTYIHPACKLGPEIIQFDLAMYKVFEPWDFGGRVKPAWLPNADWVVLNSISREMTENSEKCTIVGWGTENTDMFLNLLEADVELSSWAECKKNYCKRCPNFEAANLCTKPKKKVSVCDGDQGGPIICRQVVWGVISYPRAECGEPHYHSYARTGARTTRTWIKDISGVMSLGTALVGNLVFIILCILAQLHVY